MVLAVLVRRPQPATKLRQHLAVREAGADMRAAVQGSGCRSFAADRARAGFLETPPVLTAASARAGGAVADDSAPRTWSSGTLSTYEHNICKCKLCSSAPDTTHGGIEFNGRRRRGTQHEKTADLAGKKGLNPVCTRKLRLAFGSRSQTKTT